MPTVRTANRAPIVRAAIRSACDPVRVTSVIDAEAARPGEKRNDVEAEPGRDGALSVRCELADAPGLAVLSLTNEAAEAKFCAEPAAAGVFGP